MRMLSLFSGIGGLDIGIKEAFPDARTIAYVEADPYCRRVLDARMADGRLDHAPIFPDVRGFEWPAGGAEGICGGFPCQDLSYAGKGAGLDGDRSGLWFEFARLIGMVRPRYVFVENVGALLVRGLDRVLADLAGMGFDAEWACVRASDAGAPHRRERLFILAYLPGKRSGAVPDRQQNGETDFDAGRNVAAEMRLGPGTPTLADCCRSGLEERASERRNTGGGGAGR